MGGNGVGENKEGNKKGAVKQKKTRVNKVAEKKKTVGFGQTRVLFTSHREVPTVSLCAEMVRKGWTKIEKLFWSRWRGR